MGRDHQVIALAAHLTYCRHSLHLASKLFDFITSPVKLALQLRLLQLVLLLNDFLLQGMVIFLICPLLPQLEDFLLK